jgi:hypothetical protein
MALFARTPLLSEANKRLTYQERHRETNNISKEGERLRLCSQGPGNPTANHAVTQHLIAIVTLPCPSTYAHVPSKNDECVQNKQFQQGK